MRCKRACVREVQNALHVEVEAGKGHDEVEVQVLPLDEEGHALWQEAAVVGGEARVLEARIEAEDGRVLDVRVVVERVGGRVVHIVRGLPPGHVDASPEVSDYEAEPGVKRDGHGDGAVTYVVTDERHVLEEEAQTDAAQRRLAVLLLLGSLLHQVHGCRPQRSDAQQHYQVRPCDALVPAIALEELVQLCEVLLHQRRVLLVVSAVVSAVVRAVRWKNPHLTDTSHVLGQCVWGVQRGHHRRGVSSRRAHDAAQSAGVLAKPSRHVVHLSFVTDPALIH